jgi:hypothetical protein
MIRPTTVATIATLAVIAVLLAEIAINLIQINPRPPVVDNGWREPAWFPPAQFAVSVQ